MKDLNLGEALNPQKEVHRTVVRLTTSAWLSSKGVHVRKDLVFLKRKCEGFNCIEEDCKIVGATEAVLTITNLYDVKDGVYLLMVVNERRDWETGYVEEWEHELVPYTEPTKQP